MALLKAWRYVESIDRIDIDELVARGVKLLLVDRDNTCVPRNATSAPPEVVEWFARAREAGLELCLISNNIHVDALADTARDLGCDVITHAFKPSPHALLYALRRYGVSREHSAMIGDQIFTDIAAGNLAGIRTILVHPQCEEDLWYAVPFRKLEAQLVSKEHFEG